MFRIEGEIAIDRPVAEVFDVVADERNEPHYNPNMVHVEKLSPGPVGLGTRFRATIRSMGRDAPMAVELTGFDRPVRLGLSSHMSVMDVHGAMTFEPIGDTTRMRWSWDVEPHGAFRLLAPLVARVGRRQEAAIWVGLKHLLETGGLERSGA